MPEDVPTLPSNNCYVCRKHQDQNTVPGGAIYEDDLIYVGHAAIPEGHSSTYLGSLLVEPKRHVPSWAELSPDEAKRIGLALASASRVLKDIEGAEHVYVFVLGHQVPHLHVWVVPRYPGTPRRYWGLQVDEWPGAPRGGPEAVSALCQRVRASFSDGLM